MLAMNNKKISDFPIKEYLQCHEYYYYFQQMELLLIMIVRVCGGRGLNWDAINIVIREREALECETQLAVIERGIRWRGHK